MALQNKNVILKSLVLNDSFKDLLYTKINQTEIWFDAHTRHEF